MIVSSEAAWMSLMQAMLQLVIERCCRKTVHIQRFFYVHTDKTRRKSPFIPSVVGFFVAKNTPLV